MNKKEGLVIHSGFIRQILNIWRKQIKELENIDLSNLEKKHQQKFDEPAKAMTSRTQKDSALWLNDCLNMLENELVVIERKGKKIPK